MYVGVLTSRYSMVLGKDIVQRCFKHQRQQLSLIRVFMEYLNFLLMRLFQSSIKRTLANSAGP